MSGVYLFNFLAPLRDDVSAADMSVLESWAAGCEPSEQQLAALALGVRGVLPGRLARWMPRGEIEHGTPVMIATHRGQRMLAMTVFMHEGEFANGGWKIFSWVFDLLDRSFVGPVGTIWFDEEGVDTDLLIHMPGTGGPQLARVAVTRTSKDAEGTHAFSVRRVGLELTDSFADHLTKVEEWEI